MILAAFWEPTWSHVGAILEPSWALEGDFWSFEVHLEGDTVLDRFREPFWKPLGKQKRGFRVGEDEMLSFFQQLQVESDFGGHAGAMLGPSRAPSSFKGRLWDKSFRH